MNQHSLAAHDSSPIIDPQTLIENPHMNFAALRVHYPVIRLGERDRLQVCSAEDCDDVYVDLSRNRSRKFCDGTCGTKANVAAYRARKAAEVD